MKKRLSKFIHDQTVYLTNDRSEWKISHVIIDRYGIISYRIDNGYMNLDVDEIHITDNPDIVIVGGFKK